MPQRPSALAGYLEAVGREIRWPLARRLLLRELGDHIEDQRRDCEAEGLEPAQALQRAVEEMGDPVEVGKELDRLHRPKRCGWVIWLAGIMAAISVLLTEMMYDGYSADPARQLLCALLGLGLCVLLWHTDYTVLLRRTGLFCLLFLAPLPVLALVQWMRYPDGSRFMMRYFIYLSFLAPIPFTALLCRIKGGGWRQLLFFSLMIPLLAGPAVWGWSGTAALLSGLVMCLLLCTALRQRRFHLRPIPGAACALLPSLLACAIYLLMNQQFMLRLSVLINPELDPLGMGFTSAQFQTLISTLPMVNLSRSLPAMTQGNTIFLQYDFFFVRLSAICGWIILPAVLLITLIAAALILRRLSEVKYREGRLLGLATGLLLTLQALSYVLYNCGLFLLSPLTFPFLSFGPVLVLVDCALLGLILSVLRHNSLPFPAPPKLDFKFT